MSTRPRDEVPAHPATSSPRAGTHWTLVDLAAEISGVLPGGVPLLAFSGGADSTALLHALLRVSTLRHLAVAHVDHGLDPDSGRRADAAQALAVQAAEHAGWQPVTEAHGPVQRLGNRTLLLLRERLRITGDDRRRHGGIEASARGLRYRALERLRGAAGAQFVITAHHAGDQLETLILRLRQGTGLVGLAGIRTHATAPGGGPVLRPLLDLATPPDGHDLRCLLTRARATWIEDPTNADLSLARNSIRRRILPRILLAEPGSPDPQDAAVRLARAAARFASWRVRWTRSELGLRGTGDGVDLDFDRWRRLPHTLRDHALGAMHRAAGRRSDPPATARRELHRQVNALVEAQADAQPGVRSEGPREAPSGPIQHGPAPEASGATPGPRTRERPSQESPTERQLFDVRERCTGQTRRRVACAAGSAHQWVVAPATEVSIGVSGGEGGSGARLQLRPEPSPSDPSNLGGAAEFTYTPRIPGVTEMPELGCRLQVTREPFDGWMTRAWPDRAACHLPDPRATVTVRTRTTGDTLHPFGSPSKRVKLKKLLIDRKVPRNRRSLLPLVCVDGEIAWVPGVTIGDSFRIPARFTGEGSGRSGHRSDKSDRPGPTNLLVWVFRLLPIDSNPTPPSLLRADTA